jgi:hypothetical protein
MARRIPLTKGFFALVDDEDYESLVQWSWSYDARKHTGYAKRPYAPEESRYMHHVVVGTRKRLDHIDGNGLNNRRNNLRPATKSQNGANRQKTSSNTIGFKGVVYDKRRRKWYGQIQVEYHKKHLGTFSTPEDAAQAYERAASEHFGEFAVLNFPKERT